MKRLGGPYLIGCVGIASVVAILSAAPVAGQQPSQTRSTATHEADQDESAVDRTESSKVDGQENADEIKAPELAAELHERMKKDQEARFALLELMQKRGGRSGNIQLDDESSVVIVEMRKIDAENRQWLKDVIEKHGWPGKSLVGTEAAHAAWLLVQHADADPEFQKKCLALMEEAGTDEVSGADIAYLTDRVLVADQKPQRYGTQVEQQGEEFVVKEVEDPEHLNERRADVGLPPIEEYLELVKSMYAGQQKGDDSKDDDSKDDDSKDDDSKDDNRQARESARDK